MVIIIQNGYILNPADGREGIFDILIEDGVIQGIAPKITAQADRIIDASNCYVMPGFIDLHVHFLIKDNKNSSTTFRQCGGVSSYLSYLYTKSFGRAANLGVNVTLLFSPLIEKLPNLFILQKEGFHDITLI